MIEEKRTRLAADNGKGERDMLVVLWKSQSYDVVLPFLDNTHRKSSFSIAYQVHGYYNMLKTI